MAHRGVRLASAVLVVMLVGCATTKIVKVEVPVPVPCPPATMPTRPELPEITPDMPPEEQFGKLKQALVELVVYAKELEEKLKGYVAPPEPPK